MSPESVRRALVNPVVADQVELRCIGRRRIAAAATCGSFGDGMGADVTGDGLAGVGPDRAAATIASPQSSRCCSHDCVQPAPNRSAFFACKTGSNGCAASPGNCDRRDRWKGDVARRSVFNAVPMGAEVQARGRPPCSPSMAKHMRASGFWRNSITHPRRQAKDITGTPSRKSFAACANAASPSAFPPASERRGCRSSNAG